MAFVLLAAVACGTFQPREGPSPTEDRDRGEGADLARVTGFLEGEAGEDRFSGVVLVARHDEVELLEAYGLAEAEHRVSMRTDHVFRIGSLTKPVTASAVLVSVERGELALEDRLCDLVAPCPDGWGSVTVRHLLSHSSGIPDHFGDLEAVPVDETLDELRRVLEAIPNDATLEVSPGSAYSYSNFNYVLLGAILEGATETSWPTALEELLFEPLGLETMRYDDIYAIVEDRVRGYRRDETGGLRNIAYDDHAAYAAGGLLSDASDLLRWSRAVFSARLFSTDLVRESVTPVVDDYGLGWQVRRFFDRRIYNHTGGIDGFSSHLAYYPDEELTLIVLTNVENDSAILRACDVAALLFDRRDVTAGSIENLTPRQRCGLEPRKGTGNRNDREDP